MDKASLIEAVNGHIDDKAITPRVLQQWWDKVSQNLSTGGDGSVYSRGDVPVGAQLPFGGTDVPYGWLLCDGSAVSRTDYADLFAVIGTAYGAGDGSTTFNLPDKRGRVSVGLKEGDTDFANIGKDGGEKKHKLTMDEIPNFKFSTAHVGYSDSIWSATNGTHTSGTGRGWANQQDEAQRANINTGFYHDFSFGGGGSHNNLQPYEVDNWVIKALPVVSRITIGNNDNWFVDGIDTGHTSRGKTGDTGKTGPQGETGPQGPQGKSGVYIGENEPSDPDINVWVETDGYAEDYALKKDIPTKVSELENDSGFIDDLSDYYKKSEVYKKDEVYNKDEVFKKEETYSKSSIDKLSSSLDKRVKDLETTNSDVLEQLEDKADKRDIPSLDGYAKEQWVLDKEYITKYVGDLVNYYSKDSVYNKEEVNAIASSIQNVSIEIVNYLPSTGKTNVIYFLSKTGTTGDVFDEYIFINNSWEHIGSTEVDLSAYATTEWVNGRGFITNLVDNLVNYYTKSEVYSKDEVYNKSEVYKKSEVYNKDETFSKSEVYSKSNVYNKTEINNLTEAIDERMSSLEEVGGDLIQQVKNKADKKDIPSLDGYATTEWVNGRGFITNLANNLVNYYLKDEVYNKEEINDLANSLQNVSITIVNTLPNKGQTNVIYFVSKTGSTNDIYDEYIYINNVWEHIGSTEVDLTGYATEQWVNSKNYMPIPDFHEFMKYAYYDKTQTDEKFKDYYNKEEVDTKLENLQTGGGGTNLTGGDNTVIEDNAINVYTNTGYKVIDKDIRLQPILAISNSNQNRMVYTLDEVIVIYDGTNQIRRSENGIDFETVTLPCVCTKLAYNEDNKRLYGTDNSSNFFYSDDNGLTWTLIPNNRASNVTSIDIGYGAGFRATYRSTKEIILWYFGAYGDGLSINSRITSTIYPDFTAMANSTQFIWCNSSGTVKYGAGSKEGDFHSVSGVTVNMLKRVNDITFMGLKNNNKLYYLRSATGTITAYRWIAYDLPETCTLNDIIYNPHDETYYLYTNINTYYKTKDFVEYESVDKDGLRGTQGYFTLMGIQSVTSEKNKLLLAPTRTTLENKAQEWDRILDKSRWVGDGLEVVGEQIKPKVVSPLRVSTNGIGLGVVEDHNLPGYVIEGAYVAMGEEKGLFDPYEIENWFWTEDAYPVDDMYKAVKFIFNQAGSFYNQITWEEEYYVEQYEYGYLYYDQNMNIFKYKKLGNLSWMFE